MQSLRRITRLSRFRISSCVKTGREYCSRRANINTIEAVSRIHVNLKNINFNSKYSTQVTEPEVDSLVYEKACEETLESLSDYFEHLVEETDTFVTADVSYSGGVLTVNLGDKYGIYVINRQSPNKQIWLSSPLSGPKRYDFIADGGYWVYKHDGKTLHQLLQEEISKLVDNVDFSKCVYAKL